ncbi:MAG: penicillin-binding protein activator [Pseudomonadota bacterium]
MTIIDLAGGGARQGRGAARLTGAARAAGRVLTAIAAAALVAACASTPRGAGDGRTLSQSAPSAPAINQDVGAVPVDANGRAVVALLSPTGDSRPQIRQLAQSIANAARLARSDIGDSRLDLRIYDTKGTVDGAAVAANQAVADGAGLILGPFFAQPSRAIAPIAARAGVGVISFSTDRAVAGDNLYLIGFLPGQEVPRVVDYARGRGIATLSALAPTGAYGDLLMSAMRSAAARSGGRLVDEERYERSFRPIEAAMTRYAERHRARAETDPIQGVIIADQGQALQSLAAYLAYLDVSPREVKFLGVDGWSAEATLKEPALRGGWFAAPDPRLREQFAARFGDAYGVAPHPLASLGYDAVAAAGAMLADARAKGDRFPFTSQAITDPAGFAGVNGVYRFQPNGLNERGLAVLEVGPDGFRIIDPAPTSFTGI